MAVNPIYLIPHRRFCEVLVLRLLSQKTVNDRLKEYSLPLIQGDAYSQIRGQLSRLYPEHFNQDPNNFRIDVDILNELQVKDMFAYLFDTNLFTVDDFPIDVYRDVFKALNDPRLRRELQTMAMAGIDEADIELYANGRQGTAWDTEIFMLFFKYFFNVFSWSYEELEIYRQHEENKDLKRLYTMALKKDKDFVVYNLGLTPDRSFGSMLESLFRTSFYNFDENSRYNPDQSKKWGDLMLKAYDRIRDMENSDSDSTDLYADLKINLKTINPSITIKSAEELGVELPDPNEMGGGTMEDVSGMGLDEIEAVIKAKKKDKSDEERTA